MTRDAIEEVRNRTDIIQVIGKYVALEQSGVNHKGICPFHGGTDRQFNVNAKGRIYYCFGCQRSGDVIGFLMAIHSRSFRDVVVDLAAAMRG